MTAKTTEQPPKPTEFEIPLSEAELAELGRFTAVFSQVDFLLGEAISLLTGTPWWAMQLMLENASIGPKLNVLRKIIPDVKDKEAKRLAKEACDRMAKLLDRRNHVIHGLWARQIISAQRKATPACIFQKFSENYVPPDQLRDLSDRGASVTRYLGDLLTHVSAQKRGVNPDKWTRPRRLLVTDQPVEAPGSPLRDVPLTRMGYPNPGGTLPK
ncbi:MAG: hypothetical protein AB7S93_10040 [Xanthobacteraceae bacterium]